MSTLDLVLCRRHAQHLARSNTRDGRQHVGHKGQQVFERIARGDQHNHAESTSRHRLLMLEVLVPSDEDLVTGCFSGREQNAVLQASPRLLLNGSHLVADQVAGQLPR